MRPRTRSVWQLAVVLAVLPGACGERQVRRLTERIRIATSRWPQVVSIDDSASARELRRLVRDPAPETAGIVTAVKDVLLHGSVVFGHAGGPEVVGSAVDRLVGNGEAGIKVAVALISSWRPERVSEYDAQITLLLRLVRRVCARSEILDGWREGLKGGDLVLEAEWWHGLLRATLTEDAPAVVRAVETGGDIGRFYQMSVEEAGAYIELLSTLLESGGEACEVQYLLATMEREGKRDGRTVVRQVARLREWNEMRATAGAAFRVIDVAAAVRMRMVQGDPPKKLAEVSGEVCMVDPLSKTTFEYRLSEEGRAWISVHRPVAWYWRINETDAGLRWHGLAWLIEP